MERAAEQLEDTTREMGGLSFTRGFKQRLDRR